MTAARKVIHIVERKDAGNTGDPRIGECSVVNEAANPMDIDHVAFRKLTEVISAKLGGAQAEGLEVFRTRVIISL